MGYPLKVVSKGTVFTFVTDKNLEKIAEKDIVLEQIDQLQQELKIEKLNIIAGGGSVMNAMLVLENRPAIMFKFPKKETGGGSIWDFAATACIYKELQLRATDYKGAPLDLNRKDTTFMNDKGVWYENL